MVEFRRVNILVFAPFLFVSHFHVCAYPDGAPEEACADMLCHQNQPPAPHPGGFNITLSRLTCTPNEDIHGVIMSPANGYFKGFLLRAVRADSVPSPMPAHYERKKRSPGFENRVESGHREGSAKRSYYYDNNLGERNTPDSHDLYDKTRQNKKMKHNDASYVVKKENQKTYIESGEKINFEYSEKTNGGFSEKTHRRSNEKKHGSSEKKHGSNEKIGGSGEKTYGGSSEKSHDGSSKRIVDRSRKKLVDRSRKRTIDEHSKRRTSNHQHQKIIAKRSIDSEPSIDINYISSLTSEELKQFLAQPGNLDKIMASPILMAFLPNDLIDTLYKYEANISAAEENDEAYEDDDEYDDEYEYEDEDVPYLEKHTIEPTLDEDPVTFDEELHPKKRDVVARAPQSAGCTAQNNVTNHTWNRTPLGRFIVINTTTKTVCKENGTARTLTHTDNLKKTETSFVWRAPANLNSDIIFIATVVVNGTLWWNSIESPTVFLDLENVMTRPSSTIANITAAPVANITAPSTANITVKATAISSIGENKTFGNTNTYTTLTTRGAPTTETTTFTTRTTATTPTPSTTTARSTGVTGATACNGSCTSSTTTATNDTSGHITLPDWRENMAATPGPRRVNLATVLLVTLIMNKS